MGFLPVSGVDSICQHTFVLGFFPFEEMLTRGNFVRAKWNLPMVIITIYITLIDSIWKSSMINHKNIYVGVP
jgi:hypothetical protein